MLPVYTALAIAGYRSCGLCDSRPYPFCG